MLNVLEGLNEVQQEAVKTTEGPLLILAGAGTGKTKVLTSRIANILNKRLANTQEILAVTFTNKAAKEMRHRIETLLAQSIEGFWIGTFHSVGLRIMKRHLQELGLKPNFSILDTADSEKIIKQILLDNNIDTKKTAPKMVLDAISKLKDKNIGPDDVSNADNKDLMHVKLSTVYKTYTIRLRELNAVDFGDLLLMPVDLFRQFPDVLAHWQNKFKYILVDEYQDTNALQYTFVKLLALRHNNLCCVGDDDQSIYSWRGAEIANILKFADEFPGAKVLRLEQNYRSFTPILKIASSLIARNKSRYDKTLWTQSEENIPVKLVENVNSKTEAEFIASEVERLVRRGVKYKDIAILVRASFQTREIEEGLKNYAIPYKVVSGTGFYDRLEIKDMIAYLRLHNQKSDDLAYFRIINTPKRSIGASSIEKIQAFARSNGLSMFEASKKILCNKILSTKVEQELSLFVNMFEEWEVSLKEEHHAEVFKSILEDSGYLNMWQSEKSLEAENRVDNLKELYNALLGYASLEEFLENIVLDTSHSEETMQEAADNSLAIMTLHGAKGLEFKAVFLPGWEEGVFPNPRALDENGDASLQEERRLAYVGITRAREELYILYANNRQIYGNWQVSIKSRFIDEVPHGLFEVISNAAPAYNNTEAIRKDPFLNKAVFPNQYSHEKQKSFKVGEQVKHNTMGVGVIESLNGVIASVTFAGGISKKIMTSFLNKA